MSTTNILDLNNRIDELEKNVGGGGDTSALVNKTDIAPEFSDATNYYKGDLVYYNGILYEFQLDHTAGAWEQSEVQQKDLSDILNTLSDRVDSLTASDVTYDNTDSGLAATNEQSAIDELAAKLGLKPSVIWENPNPTDAFVGTTLQIDASDAKFILMETDYGCGWGTPENRAVVMSLGSSSGLNYVFRRTLTVSGSTLVISDTIAFKMSDGTETTLNNIIIPKKIYRFD